METEAKRTLVKSAPELWELADDPTRMQAWTGELIGGSPEVEVIERRAEQRLTWRTARGEPPARIALELAESGFGTSVKITAQHQCAEASDILERLLDELGSPERRPFIRG